LIDQPQISPKIHLVDDHASLHPQPTNQHQSVDQQSSKDQSEMFSCCGSRGVLKVECSNNWDWEEVLNSLSHGFSFFVFLGLFFFFSTESSTKTERHYYSSMLFIISWLFTFGSSTLFHTFSKFGLTRKIFHRLDHMAISVIIAASYTPVLFVPLAGTRANYLLIFQWGCVILSGFLDILYFQQYPKLKILLFVLMGWSGVLAGGVQVAFTCSSMQSEGGRVFFWLASAGGACFMIGLVFYSMGKRQPIYHCVWHCFVSVGAFIHAYAIYFYMMPLSMPDPLCW
jgi:hemolysin III